MISSPNWIPSSKSTGKEMEVHSILGPFFRLTAFSDLPTNDFFANISNLHDEELIMTQVRAGLNAAQSSMHQILLALLKSSPQSKEAVLNWIAAVIERNKPRLKMQVDRAIIASDGFFINFNMVLLALCKPIVDPANPKVLSSS